MFEGLFKYPASLYSQGSFELASAWPLWVLTVLGLAGSAWLGRLVYRNGRDLGPRSAVVWLLQCGVLWLVLGLVWQPVLVLSSLKSGDNVVAVAMDNSISMYYDHEGMNRQQRALAALSDAALDPLAASFNLQRYASPGVPLDRFDQMPPAETRSDLAATLTHVLQSSRSTPLAAVVLVSDGADNSGRLSAEALDEIAGFGVPVHAVAAGRELMPEDLELAQVDIDTDVPGESRLTARVLVRHDGPATTRLTVLDGDSVVYTEALTMASGQGTSAFPVDLELGDRGVRDLTFNLEPLAGERNIENNSLGRVINVGDSVKRVLYIEGEPRWEYKFLRRALLEDPTVELVSMLRTSPNKYYRQGLSSGTELEDGFPLTRRELFGFHGIIIGSIEAPALSEEQQLMIRDFVSERGGGLLMLAGRSGLGDGGWGNSPVAEALPARMPLDSGSSFVRRQAAVRLTPAGQAADLLQLDADPGENQRRWAQIPRVASYQVLGSLRPGAATLLEVQTERGQQPLLVTQRYGMGQSFILASGGTWRWQMSLPAEDQSHEVFWRQLVRTLVAETPQRLEVVTEENPAGQIELQVRARNAEFEPALDARVSAVMRSADGQQTEIELRPGNRPGEFQAVLDSGPGMTSIETMAALGPDEELSARRYYRSQSTNPEYFGIRQRPAVLERIALATGGRLWQPDELAGLPAAINFSTAGVTETRRLDLWDMPAAFLLLLMLKLSEWLLRLRWGRL